MGGVRVEFRCADGRVGGVRDVGLQLPLHAPPLDAHHRCGVRGAASVGVGGRSGVGGVGVP